MMTTDAWLDTMWQFYAAHGRHDLPWRRPDFDPYNILVSELMLQQTQVSRVIPRYHTFLQQFPTVADLAAAPLGDVLVAWSGLGYNRRAKFLLLAGRQLAGKPFPRTIDELVALPGVGVNTAGAILAYAYDQPVIFIETNIRTVYLHHCFPGQTDVPDSAIRAALAETLDRNRPREFYWALMDYGSHLKQTVGQVHRASRSYVKQSTFAGSRRQIRGAVLRELAAGSKSREQLAAAITDDRLTGVLEELAQESMINQTAGGYTL